MTAEAKKKLSDPAAMDNLLACSLCNGCLAKPKILKCTHLFCQKCLQDYVSVSASNNCFPCFFCQENTSIPAEGVTGFRDSSFISHLLVNCNTGVNTKHCLICALDSNRKVDAVGKCNNCSKYLCAKCVGIHQKSYAGHTFCTMDDLLSSMSMNLQSGQIKCVKHRDQVMCKFCNTCQVRICQLCEGEKHEDHDLTTVETAIIGKREYLKTSAEGLRRKVKNGEAVVKTTYEDISNLENQARRVIKGIENDLKVITRKANDAIREVKSLSSDETSLHGKLLEQSSLVLKQVRNLGDHIKLLAENGSDAEILDNYSLLVDRVEQTVEVHKVVPREANILERDKNAPVLLETVSSGLFTLNRTHFDRLTVTSPEIYPLPEKGYVDNIASYGDKIHICSKGKVYVRESGKWKAVDKLFQAGNKAYDVHSSEKYTILSKKARGSSSELVLVDNLSHAVTNIKLPFNSGSPAVIPFGKVDDKQTFLVANDLEKLVLQVNINGQIVNKYGEGVLQEPHYLHADSQGGFIVSDYGLNDVVVFRSNGSVTCRLREQNNLPRDVLDKPCGVCIDSDGYIFVVARATGKVLAFSTSGKYIANFPTEHDGLKQPTAIALGKNGELLITDATSIKLYDYSVNI